MKPNLKLASHLILLLILVFQAGCTSSEGQKRTITPLIPTKESITPIPPTTTAPVTVTVSPVLSATIEMPTLGITTPSTPIIQDTPPAQLGIGFGAFLDVQSPDTGLALMAAAEMNWVHIPFSWSTVEPQVGQRKWGGVSNSEIILRTATDFHLNSILYVNDTPSWALKSGYTCGAVGADKFTDMARFLSDMVKRYSVAPFNVKYYELWSEPEVSGFLGCWGDPGDPNYYGGGYYGEMLKVAYPAIKAADPQAQVLFAGLLLDCNPEHVEYCGGNLALRKSIAHFFEGALMDGAGPYFDGISFHAYDYYGSGLGQYNNVGWNSAWNTTGPVTLVKAAYLRSLLAKYNVAGKYLINTEVAILCGRTGQEAPCTTEEHARTVSAYIVQAYASGIAGGLLTSIWYSAAGWRGSALLDAHLNPLPAYTTYQFSSVRLSNATFVKPITNFPEIKGYEFIRNGHQMWVLWSVSITSNPQTIILSNKSTEIFDMYGSALPVENSLNVGLEPVFIEFGS
jgi:hypothetical protein